MKAKEFKEVLIEELEEISHSRDLRKGLIEGLELPSVSDSQNAYQKAAKSELFGLAFSGGGIRSATFNLGILQGLAQFRLLPRIDYLSTVSGGGYIGSWLATVIKRLGLKRVAEGLGRDTQKTREQEPQEIQHLRQFSNYLTPPVGVAECRLSHHGRHLCPQFAVEPHDLDCRLGGVNDAAPNFEPN